MADAGIKKDKNDIDMKNINCYSKPIKTIIHAIGPNGKDLKTFTDKNTFDTALEKTLSDLKNVVETLVTPATATDPIDLRIPLISASIYGFKDYNINDSPNEKYFAVYLSKIYKIFKVFELPLMVVSIK